MWILIFLLTLSVNCFADDISKIDDSTVQVTKTVVETVDVKRHAQQCVDITKQMETHQAIMIQLQSQLDVCNKESSDYEKVIPAQADNVEVIP